MKRMIALLLLLCALTACAADAPEAADQPDTVAPSAENALKPAGAASMKDEATAFSQAPPERLT